ncbi:hypothetical protein [Paenibacillus elgii]|uniref:hypothetical protein n=1 Tax=Paenibacillus elgii TaxID=189691 RepID=UPI000248E09A|nr:hypothetical protein [Paenibacillus elgii]
MAIVRNLIVRAGADFSPAKKAMSGFQKDIDKLGKKATKSVGQISGGGKGIGAIASDFKNMGSVAAGTISRLRGAKGIGGVTSELASFVPAIGQSASSLRGLSGASSGAASALRGLGVGAGVAVAAIGVVVAGIAAASQTAAKFESTIMRLNMQLKGSSREFMDWARAQGLAKTDAAQLGATYSVLLSSFIGDTKKLKDETKALVSATRVVASATGRSIEDTLERMRSGLLGNTEAIEDLGIFVNVSMIESTNAFKKFANGKSWEQLNFKVQQQIRLAAILEQAYARYGNEVQKNVMTKQDALSGQLKDIQLNLSQAFLPIWDSILPALIRFAEALAQLTERLARFSYWVKGWDYDALTRGTDKNTEATKDQSKAYDDLSKSAAKAKNQLMAFDEINQLDNDGGGGKGGTGGTGPGAGGGSSSSGGGFKLPEMPDLPPLPKLQLQFELPNPPDAGAGAVAAAVTATINALVSEVKAKINSMWEQLSVSTQTELAGQQALWASMVAGIGTVTIPAFASSVTGQWAGMWSAINSIDMTGSLSSQMSWSNLWAFVLPTNALNALITTQTWSTMWNNISISTEAAKLRISNSITELWENIRATKQAGAEFVTTLWSSMLESMESSLTTASTAVKTQWHETLDYLQSQLNAYVPYLQWGFTLLGASVLSMLPNLMQIESAWSKAMSNMLSAIQEKTSPILQYIESIKSAWASLMATIGAPIQFPPIQFPEIKLPDLSGIKEKIVEAITPTPVPGALPGRDIPILGQALTGLDKAGDWVESSGLGGALRNWVVPGASGAGVGGAISGGGAKVGDKARQLWESLKSIGIEVPAFARGGIVSGPTLAMIGEAGTEAVVPLEDTSFVDSLASAVGTAVMTAMQTTGGSGSTAAGGDIVLSIDGVAFARITNAYNADESRRIGGSMITTMG